MEFSRTQPRVLATGIVGTEPQPFNSVPSHCSTMMPYIHVIGQTMCPTVRSTPFARTLPTDLSLSRSLASVTGCAWAGTHVCNVALPDLQCLPQRSSVSWPPRCLAASRLRPRPRPLTPPTRKAAAAAAAARKMDSRAPIRMLTAPTTTKPEVNRKAPSQDPFNFSSNKAISETTTTMVGSWVEPASKLRRVNEPKQTYTKSKHNSPLRLH